MPWYEEVSALAGVALLGWLGGMVTFKRSMRWCKVCGATLMCLTCHRRAARPMGTANGA